MKDFYRNGLANNVFIKFLYGLLQFFSFSLPSFSDIKFATAHCNLLPYNLQFSVFSQALVECEDESIDLSGDVGAVGRVVITDNEDMLLDLKGKHFFLILCVTVLYGSGRATDQLFRWKIN